VCQLSVTTDAALPRILIPSEPGEEIAMDEMVIVPAFATATVAICTVVNASMRIRFMREQLNRSEPPTYAQVIELVELLEVPGKRARVAAVEVSPTHGARGETESGPAAGSGPHS
jgi:hypothetical protein